MKKITQYIGITLISLVSTNLLAEGQKPQGLPAEVIKVEPSTLIQELQAVGTLEAWESVVIRPEQAGIVSKIGFNEGQSVEEGSTLFALDADTYEAQVGQARARVKLSQLEYKRAEQLHKKRVGSANDRDSTLAQLRVDEAQLQVTKTALNKMTIKAPYSGVVGLKSVSRGDYVTVGQDLVTLVDLSSMKVEFKLPETVLSQVKVGQPVNLSVSAYPNQTFQGEIYTISPIVDSRSHSFSVKAKIANEDMRLRPGLFTQIHVQLGSNDNALLIPEEAIIPNNNAFLVMKMDENNTIAMSPVTLGARNEAQVEVLSGIKAGDVVVTAGHIKLRPGMPITPIFPQPAQQPTESQEG